MFKVNETHVFSKRNSGKGKHDHLKKAENAERTREIMNGIGGRNGETDEKTRKNVKCGSRVRALLGAGMSKHLWSTFQRLSCTLKVLGQHAQLSCFRAPAESVHIYREKNAKYAARGAHRA